MTTSHALEAKYNAEDDARKIKTSKQNPKNKFRKITKPYRLAFVSYAF